MKSEKLGKTRRFPWMASIVRCLSRHGAGPKACVAMFLEPNHGHDFVVRKLAGIVCCGDQ